MASKTKRIHAAGKFSGGIGVRARNEFNAIEFEQRKSQQSPFHPKGKAKRIASGIWKCTKTGKVFASDAYFLEQSNK